MPQVSGGHLQVFRTVGRHIRAPHVNLPRAASHRPGARWICGVTCFEFAKDDSVSTSPLLISEETLFNLAGQSSAVFYGLFPVGVGNFETPGR